MLKRLNALVIALTVALFPTIALADHNPLHEYQAKVVTFINELTVAGLVILPILIGLAIVAVVVWRAVDKAGGGKDLHQHDDRIKSLIGYLVVGESATALVAIVTYFFK